MSTLSLPNHRKIIDWFTPFLFHNEYKSLAGGRSSGKSHQMAILAVLRMAGLLSNPDNIKLNLPYYPPGKIRILSGRQFNTSIKQSVKVVMESHIQKMGLNDQFKISNIDITHRGTKSECFFQGIDRNIENILSYSDIDIWWFEQAEFLTPDQMRLILPTARHYAYCPVTGEKYVNEKWFVWNPLGRTDWCWLNLVEHPIPGLLHLHVNFYNNPMCPDNIKDLAARDKELYPDMYAWTWEGMPNDGNEETQVLPYKYVRACIDNWDKRPTTLSSNLRTDMGFDVAVGGVDLCAAVVRTGPIVHTCETWRGVPDLNIAARKSIDVFKRVCEEQQVKPYRIFYDGASPMEGGYRANDYFAPFEGVLFGGAVEGKDSYWDSDITNGDYFSKRNIQLGIALRQRAMRTLQLADGADVDPLNCLFINPDIKNLNSVIGMLTQPTRKLSISGRWEIEKKAGDTNAKSPDEFDAMALAFAADSQYGLRAREL